MTVFPVVEITVSLFVEIIVFPVVEITVYPLVEMTVSQDFSRFFKISQDFSRFLRSKKPKSKRNDIFVHESFFIKGMATAIKYPDKIIESKFFGKTWFIYRHL
jgi:hypothetical protein